jgi:hypothetical protein
MRMRTKLMLPAAVGASIAAGGVALGAGGDGGSTDVQDPKASGDRVFVAADERPAGRHGPPGWDRDVADVMRDVHEAVAAKAPEIAAPVIDDAEKKGSITPAQADRLREVAKSLAAGPLHAPRPDRLGLEDEDVRAVVDRALKQIAERAPGIAEPILDDAVKEKKISSAEADRIRRTLRMGPRVLHVGPGIGGPLGAGMRHRIDSDVAQTLQEIHERVRKQVPGIAGPVIDAARSDGKITSEQAQNLRRAIGELGPPPGKPAPGEGPPPPPGIAGLELGDADVRQVFDDALRAIGKRVPAIAAPVIDRAVAQDKITTGQAARIRQMLAHGPKLSHHLPDGPAPRLGGRPQMLPGAAPAPLAGQRS